MNNISFKATIKPLTYEQMIRVKWTMDEDKDRLGYPFTMKNNKSGSHYADGNWDCTYVSLNNGKTATGTQISPTQAENFDMQKLGEDYVNKWGDMLKSNDSHAVLIGSNRDYKHNPNSPVYFDFFRDLMDTYGKDMTILRGNRDFIGTDVAYDEKKDTYYVANKISDKLLQAGRDPKYVLNHMYDEVVISSKDRVE